MLPVPGFESESESVSIPSLRQYAWLIVEITAAVPGARAVIRLLFVLLALSRLQLVRLYVPGDTP